MTMHVGQQYLTSRWCWTLRVTILLVAINFDLCFGTRSVSQQLAAVLEYDGVAIQRGEVWRLLTGNLVHWNAAHFYLDVGVFVVLGLMFERSMGRTFPWLLLVTGLAAGSIGLFVWPPETRCRGLSGVDSGLFAAALIVEWRLAIADRLRWLWVAPATFLFVAKSAYELCTGRSFFSTDRLLGPASLATESHTAAIIAALTLCAALALRTAPKKSTVLPLGTE